MTPAWVGAAEGDPGGEVVLGVHGGYEAPRVLQPLPGAQELDVAPAHVRPGVALTIEPVFYRNSNWLVLSKVVKQNLCSRTNMAAPCCCAHSYHIP